MRPRKCVSADDMSPVAFLNVSLSVCRKFLNRKVQPFLRVGADAGSLRLLAQILERHRIQLDQHLALQVAPQRPHDLQSDARPARGLDRVGCAFELAHRAYDLAYGNPPALARQLISAQIGTTAW